VLHGPFSSVSLADLAPSPSLQDQTGEIVDATSLMISNLIRHVDVDVKQTSAERVRQGLPPLPDIAKVWTMRASFLPFPCSPPPRVRC